MHGKKYRLTLNLRYCLTEQSQFIDEPNVAITVEDTILNQITSEGIGSVKADRKLHSVLSSRARTLSLGNTLYSRADLNHAKVLCLGGEDKAYMYSQYTCGLNKDFNKHLEEFLIPQSIKWTPEEGVREEIQKIKIRP
jgi:hypothetical protein